MPGNFPSNVGSSTIRMEARKNPEPNHSLRVAPICGFSSSKLAVDANFFKETNGKMGCSIISATSHAGLATRCVASLDCFQHPPDSGEHQPDNDVENRRGINERDSVGAEEFQGRQDAFKGG